MKISWRQPFFVLACVLVWRLCLLIFTLQPIPANDAFGYDGPVINWLQTGQYVNPCQIIAFPISGGQVFSQYPPLYQGVVLGWIGLFGFAVPSLMTLHFLLFSIGAVVCLALIRSIFPSTPAYGIAALFLFGVTFNDRPEDLAHIFGLGALWLTATQIGESCPDWRVAFGLTGLLCLTLFTSVIVGAVYFGAGFLSCAVAGDWRQRVRCWVPFLATAGVFFVVVLGVIYFRPLWWAGFLENGHKQSVMGGFHPPSALDLLKLVRTVPIFPVALVLLPVIAKCRPEGKLEAWSAVFLGALVMGLAVIFLTMTLLAPDYVSYVIYLQIIVAAGLLAWGARAGKLPQTWLMAMLLGCCLLVSVRAVGMSTWGVLCARHDGYARSCTIREQQLQPFVQSDQPVIISSAFLYQAAVMRVRHPIHSDWYYDRGLNDPNADYVGMLRLHPEKLILTQFDYYRGYAEILAKLRSHPELVELKVSDESAVRPPDASPAWQRVIQHVSWAPVIVDLNWTTNPPLAGAARSK